MFRGVKITTIFVVERFSWRATIYSLFFFIKKLIDIFDVLKNYCILNRKNRAARVNNSFPIYGVNSL